jgi:hypothetical protein
MNNDRNLLHSTSSVVINQGVPSLALTKPPFAAVWVTTSRNSCPPALEIAFPRRSQRFESGRVSVQSENSYQHHHPCRMYYLLDERLHRL